MKKEILQRLATLSLLLSCSITVISCGGGTVNNSSTKSTGIIFGNNAGLLYVNNTLLSGNSKTVSIDANQIVGTIISNNTTYVATTAGKVYQYNETAGLWTSLPGNGPGFSLDGSSINAFVMNNNKMYAATGSGNLFTYLNNHWSIVGTNLNASITALTFDQNNNPYVGTGNGSVFEYKDGTWNNLTSNSGSVDGNNTPINSIAIYNNVPYAGTSAGEVYSFDTTSNPWVNTNLSGVEAVNSLAVLNNVLYAGNTVNNNDQTGNIESYNGSWQAPQDSPDGTPVNLLVVNNNALSVATAGNSNNTESNGQVYTYNASLGTWDKISDLNNGSVTSLTIENNYYYAGTNNFNLTQRTLYKYGPNISTWQAIGGNNSVDSSSLIFSTAVDSSSNFYAGTQNNVYKYNTTIKSWLPLANGTIDNSGVSSIATYKAITYATTFACNVYANYNSSDWEALAQLPDCFGTNLYSAIDKKTGNLYVAVNTTTLGNQNNGAVYKYNATSNEWTLLAGSGADGSLDSSSLQSIATDSLGNVYAGTGIGLVWEYPVNGSAWQLLGTGTPDTGQVITITTDSNNNLFIGTNQGNVFTYNKSLGIWNKLGLVALDGSAINTVAFDGNGILHGVTNGGNVWQYSTGNNLWINQYYGTGIPTGFSTTPSASGF